MICSITQTTEPLFGYLITFTALRFPVLCFPLTMFNHTASLIIYGNIYRLLKANTPITHKQLKQDLHYCRKKRKQTTVIFILILPIQSCSYSMHPSLWKHNQCDAWQSIPAYLLTYRTQGSFVPLVSVVVQSAKYIHMYVYIFNKEYESRKHMRRRPAGTPLVLL